MDTLYEQEDTVYGKEYTYIWKMNFKLVLFQVVFKIDIYSNVIYTVVEEKYIIDSMV